MTEIRKYAGEAVFAVIGYVVEPSAVLEGLKRTIISNLPPRYPTEESAEIYIFPTKQLPPTD